MYIIHLKNIFWFSKDIIIQSFKTYVSIDHSCDSYFDELEDRKKLLFLNINCKKGKELYVWIIWSRRKRQKYYL